VAEERGPSPLEATLRAAGALMPEIDGTAPIGPGAAIRDAVATFGRHTGCQRVWAGDGPVMAGEYVRPRTNSRPQMKMAPREPISSTPKKFHEVASLLSPWHALLPAAMALSRLMEGEMDRALAAVSLTAREAAALLEVGMASFSGEDQFALSAPGGERPPEPPRAATQRGLGGRLGLAPGAASELLARLEQRRLIRREVARESPRRVGRGRPAVAVTLTGAGDVLLAAAAAIARRVEEDWARRLAKEAAGSDVHHARANGLKRWLTESVASLRGATPAAARAAPRPRRSSPPR